ncbi:MAG: hypothetical protein HWD59_14960 [Coxiellaceae bacterium]|nr:MAG: hypothetical protein HWD59_14960 [Coxiellaceae bacterium]
MAVNKPDEFKETLKGLDVKFLEELKNNTSRFFIALFASMQYPKTANNAGRFKEIIKYFACLQEAFESINTTQNTFN